MRLAWLPVFAVLACALPRLRADEPPIIAKARAYVGAEAALDAVQSAHLTGRIETEAAGKPVTVLIDIVFQKPDQESLTAVFPDHFFRKVLDGTEGWLRVQMQSIGQPLVFDDRKSPNLTILSSQEVEQLRADTWTNLYFYRGIEKTEGSVQDLGPATIDGIACEKVVFKHIGGIAYQRYFDLTTGRLVYSVSNTGEQIRETGSLISGGIRFPQVIVLTDRDKAGKEHSTKMTLDKAVINEAFSPDYFATPLPPIAQPQPPAPKPAPASAPASPPKQP